MFPKSRRISATPRGQLNWTGPIANSSERQVRGPFKIPSETPSETLPGSGRSVARMKVLSQGRVIVLSAGHAEVLQ